MASRPSPISMTSGNDHDRWGPPILVLRVVGGGGAMRVCVGS